LFLHILSSIVFLVPFGLPSRIVDALIGLSGHRRLFVLVSSLYIFLFLVTCARLSWPHSAFQSTLNSCIVSYRMHLSFTICQPQRYISF